jgi:hydroxymethylpyrimidine pyrophosphatase-like HAD family hydrolase
VLDDAVKITGVSDDHARIALCADALRRHVGEHVSAARSQAYYVDVTHPDATKATVVQRVARLLDVPLGQVAAIGDMPNDVLMFGIAGTSIAMGNATPEVQRTARHVTTSNEDEGFAHAVESFILPGREGATCSKRGSLGFPPGTRA